jgi:hypothetical protein
MAAEANGLPVRDATSRLNHANVLESRDKTSTACCGDLSMDALGPFNVLSNDYSGFSQILKATR